MTVKIKHKNKELTVKQLKAVNLIASGMTRAEVSEELEVSTETLRLWRKDERFTEYLNDILKKVEDESIQHIRSLNAEASKTIKELMGSNSPAGIRLKAAQSIMAMSGAHQRIQLSQDIQIGEVVEVKKINHEMVLQIVAAIAEYAKSQQIIDVGNSDISSNILEIPKEEKKNEKPKN